MKHGSRVALEEAAGTNADDRLPRARRSSPIVMGPIPSRRDQSLSERNRWVTTLLGESRTTVSTLVTGKSRYVLFQRNRRPILLCPVNDRFDAFKQTSVLNKEVFYHVLEVERAGGNSLMREFDRSHH